MPNLAKNKGRIEKTLRKRTGQDYIYIDPSY